MYSSRPDRPVSRSDSSDRRHGPTTACHERAAIASIPFRIIRGQVQQEIHDNDKE
jgi:hypothetical protein